MHKYKFTEFDQIEYESLDYMMRRCWKCHKEIFSLFTKNASMKTSCITCSRHNQGKSVKRCLPYEKLVKLLLDETSGSLPEGTIWRNEGVLYPGCETYIGLERAIPQISIKIPMKSKDRKNSLVVVNSRSQSESENCEREPTIYQ